MIDNAFPAFGETENGPEGCISAPLFRGQKSIPESSDQKGLAA